MYMGVTFFRTQCTLNYTADVELITITTQAANDYNRIIINRPVTDGAVVIWCTTPYTIV